MRIPTIKRYIVRGSISGLIAGVALSVLLSYSVLIYMIGFDPNNPQGYGVTLLTANEYSVHPILIVVGVLIVGIVVSSITFGAVSAIFGALFALVVKERRVPLSDIMLGAAVLIAIGATLIAPLVPTLHDLVNGYFFMLLVFAPLIFVYSWNKLIPVEQKSVKESE